MFRTHTRIVQAAHIFVVENIITQSEQGELQETQNTDITN